MKVAGYIRVSSKGQDHALQRHAIEKAAAERGDTVAEWYCEKRSAKTMDRAELERLRSDIRAGKVRRVYGFRLDRFIRTGPADAFAFAKECHQAGAELVTIADGVHVKAGKDDIVTQVLLFAFSLAAQLELAARGDRIAARRQLAEERGESWGRPSRIDRTTAATILRMRSEGRTVRAIAAAIKVPRSTVGRVLSRNTPLATTA